MLDFNVGELATRLRAALGVRGPMPLGLDEHCIPSVLTADCSGPPFRRIPARFTLSIDAIMATAGSPAIAYVLGPNGSNNTAVNSGLAVVDGFQVIERSFTVATGIVVAKERTVSASYGRFIPALTGAQITSGILAESLENYGLDGTAAAVMQPNIAGAVAKATAQPAYFTPPMWRTPNGVTDWIPCQIPIFEAYGIAFVSDYLATAGDTARVVVNLTGLWYATGTF